MKTQRKFDAPLTNSREANRRGLQTARKNTVPALGDSRAKVPPCAKERKAQYLKKEKEGENVCLTARETKRLSIKEAADNRKAERAAAYALQSNANLTNRPKPGFTRNHVRQGAAKTNVVTKDKNLDDRAMQYLDKGEACEVDENGTEMPIGKSFEFNPE